MSNDVHFYRVAEVSELSGSRPVKRDVNGWSVLLVLDEGELHAFHNQCTHVRVKMSAARVEDGTIICPNHGARFDLKSGECRKNQIASFLEGLPPLTRFETRLQEGWIEVAVPIRPSGR